MPQTDDDTCALMSHWFGQWSEGNWLANAARARRAHMVLQSQGFIVTSEWIIVKPTQSYNPTWEQRMLIKFLCEEWDYAFADRAATPHEVEKNARRRGKQLDSSGGVA